VLLTLIALGALVTAIAARNRALAAFGEIARLRRDLDRISRQLDDLARAPSARVAAPPPPAPAPAPSAPAAATPGAPPRAAAASTPPAVQPAASTGAPAAPAAPLRPTTRVTPASGRAETLEARIGSRWLLYVGVGAIIVGVAYFVRLAFDNDWITERVRVAIGAGIGAALVWSGRRFVRAGYALYGQLLIGAGIAILYVSTYAAFNFYALIGRSTAFALMAGITTAGAALADRHRAQGLALVAVTGGFATPFLVGGDTDAQVALFGYDAVLVAGTMSLAHRREWPALNLLSFGFTVLTIAGWAAAHYTRDKYLTTELFLTLFCGMFSDLLVRTRRSARPLARVVFFTLLAGPAAYYAASLAILTPHPPALLVFLIGFTFIGIAIARRIRYEGAGLLLVWFLSAAPLLGRIFAGVPLSWRAAAAVTIAAIYAQHLAAALERTMSRRVAPGIAGIALVHVNGLWAFFAAYWLLYEAAPGWMPALAAALSGWHVVLALGLRRAGTTWHLHYAAVAATLAAIAIALQVDGAWQVIGWAIEEAGVVLVGLRTRTGWLRAAGGALLGLAMIALFALQVAAVPVGYTVLLNARAAAAFVLAGLLYGLYRVHRQSPAGTIAAVEPDAFLLGLNLVLFVLATTEVNAFWQLRDEAAPTAAPAAWRSIAWTVQAASLVRLGLTLRRDWLRLAGGLIFVLALMSLSAAFGIRVDAGYRAVFNNRVAAGLVAIASLYWLARMHARGGLTIETAGLVVLANLLTLSLVSAELSAYWRARQLAAGGRQFTLAREMSLSIFWAAYAAALIAIGIRRRYRPIRYLAIGIFAVTIAKVLAVDLAQLDRMYRVFSVMAVGVLLLVASFLYQRFRTWIAATDEAPPADSMKGSWRGWARTLLRRRRT
jgi:uncharacterized membrane protein